MRARFQFLLYVLATEIIACITLGLWRNPVVCLSGGILFTLLLPLALPMPDPLKLGYRLPLASCGLSWVSAMQPAQQPRQHNHQRLQKL